MGRVLCYGVSVVFFLSLVQFEVVVWPCYLMVACDVRGGARGLQPASIILGVVIGCVRACDRVR